MERGFSDILNGSKEIIIVILFRRCCGVFRISSRHDKP